MSDLINPEHLAEALAVLRDVLAQEWTLRMHDVRMDALRAAADRLFATPEPAPRPEAEQAVLDAAKVWYEQHGKDAHYLGVPSGKVLRDALSRLASLDAEAPPTCEDPDCTEPAGAETVITPLGRHLRLCGEHAAWFVGLMS